MSGETHLSVEGECGGGSVEGGVWKGECGGGSVEGGGRGSRL